MKPKLRRTSEMIIFNSIDKEVFSPVNDDLKLRKRGLWIDMETRGQGNVLLP